MKKKMLSVILAAVLMLNMAACGGQESGTSGETADIFYKNRSIFCPPPAGR